MYLLGYDIGSSSVKAALTVVGSGETKGLVQYPESEMEIISQQAGWAEQEPELWWENLCKATHKLLALTGVKAAQIQAIGIAYQMHGLVVVDKDRKVLRPSIIWCDSRAVEIGKEAFASIGEKKCMSRLLNSPGNFTASKLKWVKENEPELYEKIDKIMLPGDYIAMRMTGTLCTTVSGLSEGILWDFAEHQTADFLLEEYGISKSLLPEVRKSFGQHGILSHEAAEMTGLTAGIPVTYRAGDQPNNALSLGVFEPGEIAATGGTSGVVYGISDQIKYDAKSRVNGFAHVNHGKEQTRLGLLLCINGAGILYSWLNKQMAAEGTTYAEMSEAAEAVPVGSEGLRILPFGNGAERMLENRNPGAHFINVQFNRHTRAHFYRAALEGIAFSFVYGVKIMQNLGTKVSVMRVGNDNLFRSKVFSETIASLLDCRIDVMETTGAVGAAKASGIGIGLYADLQEAVSGNSVQLSYLPCLNKEVYEGAYKGWSKELSRVAPASRI